MFSRLTKTGLGTCNCLSGLCECGSPCHCYEPGCECPGWPGIPDLKGLGDNPLTASLPGIVAGAVAAGVAASMTRGSMIEKVAVGGALGFLANMILRLE